MLSIGANAPDFTLRNVDLSKVSLGDLLGKKSLIVFVPFPFTGVCSAEVCALRDDLVSLTALDANVIVITCDPVPSNARWAAENELDFPVLSDFWPHGRIAAAYGAFNEKLGVPTRVTYVLDEAGVVQDVISSPDLGAAREHELYAKALAEI